MSKAISKIKTEVAVYSYAEDAGAGFEGMDSSNFSVPNINILTNQSKGVIDGGKKAGEMKNSATGETYTVLEVVPCAVKRMFCEWTQQRGFVADHEVDSLAVKSAGHGYSLKLNGNDLVETFKVYCITPDGEQLIIPFTRTKIKRYKGWMTKAVNILIPLADGRKAPAPLFGHLYRITTVTEKNEKGAWFNFQIEFAKGNAEASRLAPEDGLYQMAKGFREIAMSGKIKEAHDTADMLTAVDDVPF